MPGPLRSFKWMQEQAANAGLHFDEDKLNSLIANKPTRPWAEQINPSFKPLFWHVGEIWPKLTYCPRLKIRYPRCNFWRYRQIHSGALIHRAALERIREADLAYRPPKLSDAFISSVKALADAPSYIATI